MKMNVYKITMKFLSFLSLITITLLFRTDLFFASVLAQTCSPVLLGSYDTPVLALGVDISGNTAYVADDKGGLQIIDVSNPSTPALLGSYKNNAWDVYVSGSMAYVANAWGGLQIIDVSNPATPVLLGSYYNPPTVVWGVYVSGNTAYVADWIRGLDIIDVSNPASPVLLANYDTLGNPRSVYVSGTTVYVADWESGLQIIDASNPAAPVLLGSYDTPSQASDVCISGNTAYVADIYSGLQIIDVSEPSTPTLLGSCNMPDNACGVHVSSNKAYVANAWNGLQIIDVSNPAVPILQGTYNTPGYAHGVYVSGSTAYVADYWSGLQIIDIGGCDGGVLACGDINVPEGFEVKVFAQGIQAPTSMAFDKNGRLFVSLLYGSILILEDTDNNGSADVIKTFTTAFSFILGIAFRGSDLYVSNSNLSENTGKVTVVRDTNGDDVADVYNDIISELPIGQHMINGLAFSPKDGKLYFTLGSTCNACEEADPRNATILRANPNGSNVKVFAKGIRNAYDLTFNNRGHLFATDNGRDDLGINEPPEELNYIVQNGDYGWPNCWDDNTQEGCEGKIKPIATFPAHSSANGITFYSKKQFPLEYRRNLFIVQFGADPWMPPKGQKVVRVKLNWRKGTKTYKTRVLDFATGFKAPLDVVVGPKGDLFVVDFYGWTIYKISYIGTP